MSILDAVRKFLRSLDDYLDRQREGESSQAQDASNFLDELFERFPFAEEARNWLRHRVRVEVADKGSTSGGGGWYPDQRLVRLNTVQYEAAIHELAHAVWDERRLDREVRDGLVAAVQRLAEDPDPRWARVRTLAGHYVHGIPTQPGFEHGMLLPHAERGTGGGPQGEWNDWEMYAGLASGCMADVRLLPPYLRRFYAGLFEELGPDAPSPESRARHA
jgi:hypothetical protein